MEMQQVPGGGGTQNYSWVILALAFHRGLLTGRRG